MCLAIPGKILEIEPPYAMVDIGGIGRKVHLGIIADPGVGEYILVHAGFAISKIDREEAEKTLSEIKKLQETFRG